MCSTLSILTAHSLPYHAAQADKSIQPHATCQHVHSHAFKSSIILASGMCTDGLGCHGSDCHAYTLFSSLWVFTSMDAFAFLFLLLSTNVIDQMRTTKKWRALGETRSRKCMACQCIWMIKNNTICIKGVPRTVVVFDVSVINTDEETLSYLSLKQQECFLRVSSMPYRPQNVKQQHWNNQTIQASTLRSLHELPLTKWWKINGRMNVIFVFTRTSLIQRRFLGKGTKRPAIPSPRVSELERLLRNLAFTLRSINAVSSTRMHIELHWQCENRVSFRWTRSGIIQRDLITWSFPDAKNVDGDDFVECSCEPLSSPSETGYHCRTTFIPPFIELCD